MVVWLEYKWIFSIFVCVRLSQALNWMIVKSKRYNSAYENTKIRKFNIRMRIRCWYQWITYFRCEHWAPSTKHSVSTLFIRCTLHTIRSTYRVIYWIRNIANNNSIRFDICLVLFRTPYEIFRIPCTSIMYELNEHWAPIWLMLWYSCDFSHQFHVSRGTQLFHWKSLIFVIEFVDALCRQLSNV